MMRPMRTTVTLDPDVAALIEKVMTERNLSFKQALNDALRAGLGSRRSAFSQRTVDLGEASVDLDKALSVAAALEDQALVEKFELRK